MLPQQLLSVASQSIEVVASQFADRQRFERSLEVMRTLEAQESLFEVTPTPDLWWGTEWERKTDHAQIRQVNQSFVKVGEQTKHNTR